MRSLSRQWHVARETIGFVPTMGALHAGHVALLEAARQKCQRVVLSIFVNPTQFGPKEDLGKYPRTFEADQRHAETAGVDAIFFPTPEEMYPAGFETYVEVGKTASGLCGAKRPGHFRGVATVVLKLLHVVDPDIAFFGQKDYQQLQVIRRMGHDFDLHTEIVGVPIVRDQDGLALSSRNVFLSPAGRQAAGHIPQALFAAEKAFTAGEREPERLLALAEQVLAIAPELKVDYLALCAADSLVPITSPIAGPAVMLLAAFVDSTRLIDNIQLIP